MTMAMVTARVDAERRHEAETVLRRHSLTSSNGNVCARRVNHGEAVVRYQYPVDLCNANRAPFHRDCPDLLARSVAVDVPCGYTG